jgi:hypothetical protein
MHRQTNPGEREKGFRPMATRRAMKQCCAHARATVRRAVYGKGSLLASSAMELITILNRCHRFSGFVYQYASFSDGKKSIEVTVRPRKGSSAVCSRCHLPAIWMPG